MWFDILKVFKIRKFEEVLKRKMSVEMKDKIDEIMGDGSMVNIRSVIDRLLDEKVAYIPTSHQIGNYLSRSGKYKKFKRGFPPKTITAYQKIQR